MRRRIRSVFVGPQEIAGFLTRISESLAHEGVSVAAFKQRHSDMQPKTPSGSVVNWLYKDQICRLSNASNLMSWLGVLIIKIRVVIYIITKIDACIYIGGRGLFGFPFEYYLFRMLGIRVVHMFVGTASRPRYLSSNAKAVINGSERSIKKLASRIKRQSKRVANFSHAATTVIENPLCGHFHRTPFINFFKLGIPIDKSSFANTGEGHHHKNDSHLSDNRKIRILHCPSKPEIKGTERIKQILNPEVLSGLNAELIIKTGVSRDVILEELSKCDFVIDQLYSDTPLAGFAAEAAYHGKLPIVGGYGWQDILAVMDISELPPSEMCHPDQLLDTVQKLCKLPDNGNRRAKDIQEFMDSGAWSSSEFAKKMLAIVSGNIDEKWLFNPALTSYMHGVGLSEEESKQIVSRLIKISGIGSLRLKHIPGLEIEFNKCQ